MNIYTKVVIDIQTGAVEVSEGYEYSGPVALCDRSLQNRAKAAQDQASQAAGAYGAQAGSTNAFLTPQLERWTVNPPGYGPMGLAQMETSAMQSGAARQGALQEASRLRALRTGNEAGLGALEASEAQGAARGAGSTIQDILAKNAMLKATEQQNAQRELGSLYGEQMRGNLGAMGQQAEDINAATNAGRSGWLQNLEGIMAMGQGLGSGAEGASTIAKMLKGG